MKFSEVIQAKLKNINKNLHINNIKAFESLYI